MRTRTMMSSAAATATTLNSTADRLDVGGHAAPRGFCASAAPAPAVDQEFSLGRQGLYGCGKGQAQRIRNPRMMGPSSPSPSLFSARVCSLCNKHFVTLQALGAHQVAHRREFEMVRRRRRDPAAAGGKAPTAHSQPAASMNLELSLGCYSTTATAGEAEEAAGLDLTLRL